MSSREIVQTITTLVMLAGCLVWVRFYRKGKIRGYILVAPLFYMANVIVFYAAIYFIGLRPEVLLFSNWSAYLRLLDGFTYIIMGLQLALECNKRA